MGQVLSGGVGRLRVRVLFKNLLQHRLACGDVLNPMQQQFGQAELSGQKLRAGTVWCGDRFLQQLHGGGDIFEVIGLYFGLQQEAFQVAGEFEQFGVDLGQGLRELALTSFCQGPVVEGLGLDLQIAPGHGSGEATEPCLDKRRKPDESQEYTCRNHNDHPDDDGDRPAAHQSFR